MEKYAENMHQKLVSDYHSRNSPVNKEYPDSQNIQRHFSFHTQFPLTL